MLLFTFVNLTVAIAKPNINEFFNPIAEKAEELQRLRNEKYAVDPTKEEYTFGYDHYESFANYTQRISEPNVVFQNEISNITMTRGVENICAIDARKLIEDFTEYNFKDINDLDSLYDTKAKRYSSPLGNLSNELIEKFNIAKPTYRQSALAYMFMRIANHQAREDIKKLLLEKIYQPIIGLLDSIIQKFPEESSKTTDYFFKGQKRINKWINKVKEDIDQARLNWFDLIKDKFTESPLLINSAAVDLMNNFEKSFATIGSWFREEYVGVFDTMNRFLWGYEHEDPETYQDVEVAAQEPKKIFMELKALYETELKNLDLAKQMREDFLQPLKQYLFELADKCFPAKGDAERIYNGYDAAKVLRDKGIFNKLPDIS